MGRGWSTGPDGDARPGRRTGGADIRRPYIRRPCISRPRACNEQRECIPSVRVPSVQTPSAHLTSYVAGKSDVLEGENTIAFSLKADVLFDFDSAEIRPAAAAGLKRVAREIAEKAKDGSEIRVDRHTDAKGDETRNRLRRPGRPGQEPAGGHRGRHLKGRGARSNGSPPHGGERRVRASVHQDECVPAGRRTREPVSFTDFLCRGFCGVAGTG